MTFSMSGATLPVYPVVLQGLANVLEKGEAYAAAKKIDPSVLPLTRLAPDMFALARQVQIACDTAKNGLSRLAGVDAPRFEDNEKTIGELKERIAKTIAYLKTLDGAAIDAAAERTIRFPLGPHRTGEMKGENYLTQFIAPNFYFHTVAAYAILRANGVDVGKMDYLGAIPITITDNPKV